METKRARLQPHRRPAKARRGRRVPGRAEAPAGARVAGGTPESVADIARGMLAELGVGALPRVALRFWDGSELAAESPASATVVVRDPEAIAHLVHAPRQLGLARAWVQGLLDVDGDLEAVLARARRVPGSFMCRPRAVPVSRSLRCEWPVPACSSDRRSLRSRRASADGARRWRATAAPCATTTISRTASTTRAGAHDGLLVRVLRRSGRHARDRPGAQARPDLPQAAAGRRASACSTSAAAGARSCCTRRSAMACDAVGVTLSEPQAELARSRAEQWAFRTASRSECRTTARSPTARSTRSQVSACTSTSGATSSVSTRARCRRCCAPAACSSTTGSPGCTAQPPRGPTVHHPLRVPGRRASPGRPTSWRAMHDARLRGPRRRVAARALRADLASVGRQPRASPRRGRRGGRRSSASGSGGSTCSARRSGSRPGRSASTRCSPRVPAPRTACRSIARGCSRCAEALAAARSALRCLRRLEGLYTVLAYAHSRHAVGRRPRS